MSPQDLTKIKQLIATAPILTASERGEWLVLLDLMDERQLKELEGILENGSKDYELRSKGLQGAVGQQVSKSAGQPISKSVNQQISQSASSNFAKALSDKKATSDKQPEVPVQKKSNVPIVPIKQVVPPAAVKPVQMPNLSHIMNLPRVGEAHNNNFDKKPITGVSPESLVKKLFGKKPANPNPKPIGGEFGKKLSQIVDEKELPASKEILELTAPVVPKPKASAVITPAAPAAPVKPIVPAKIPEQKPETMQSKDVLIQTSAPVVIQDKSQSPAKPFFPEKPAVKMPPPAFPLKKPLNTNLEPAFKPGLNIQMGSVKSTNETLEKIKQNIQAHPQKPVPIISKAPVVQQNIPLNSLNDLTQFSAKSLNDWDLDQTVAKIKTLINQFGYFEVIFNIEKSPVYKIYIGTGLKMLTAQVDFEQLTLKMQPGEFLARPDFEKFTDLLARIQAS